MAVLFAAFLRDVFSAITSPSSGTADSITSFPSLLATGKTYVGKIQKTVRAIVPARAPNPLPRCLGTPEKTINVSITVHPLECFYEKLLKFQSTFLNTKKTLDCSIGLNEITSPVSDRSSMLIK